jgi:O-antigen/teichoic acid export membrane protein
MSRRILHNIASNYVALGAQVAYTVLMTPYLVSRLGVTAFGAWAIVLSVIGYLLLIDMGIGPSTARFVAAARTPAELNGIVATSVAVLSAAGGIALLLGLVVALYSPHLFGDVEGLSAALIVAAGLTALQIPLAVFGNVLYGLQRIVERNVAMLLRSVIKAVASVVVIEMGGDFLHFVVAALLAELVVLLGQAAWCVATVDGLRLRLRHVTWERFREIAPFSLAILGILAATQITLYSDALVIGAGVGAAAAGIYAVAMRAVGGLSLLLGQFPNVFMPRFAELDASGEMEKARVIVERGTRVSLAVGYPLIALSIGLGGPLLHAWVGDGFEDAWIPLALLAGGVAFNAPLNFAVFWAVGAARHQRIAVYSIVDALANVALSIVLVGPLGVNGVALATFIALAVSNGWFMPRAILPHLELSVWRAYHRPMLLAGALVAPFTLMMGFVVAPAIEDSAVLVALVSAVWVALGTAMLAIALAGARPRRRAVAALRRRVQSAPAPS